MFDLLTNLVVKIFVKSENMGLSENILNNLIIYERFNTFKIFVVFYVESINLFIIETIAL